MRTSALAWLFFLCGATAAAHEKPFRAIWVQPVAPIANLGLIVPVGLTEGLGSGFDLTVELTPYVGLHRPQIILDAGTGGGCGGGPCTGIGLHGLISTIGVAFEHPFASSDEWEMGVFVGAKALMAVATEPGTPSGTFGVTYEVGFGFDTGVEVHARRFGLYAALVFGVQGTRAFSSGNLVVPATWPVQLRLYSMSAFASPDVPTVAPSLNLVRIGWKF